MLETAAPVRRIVVLRPNHRLGNTLLLTPLIQELELHFPGAEIELVGGGRAGRAVFQQFPQVTTLHTFPARSYSNPGQVMKLLLALRERSYDLAIDPIPRSRSGRFLLSLVRARVRIGYRWGVRIRDCMLTHAVSPALAPVHCAHSPLYLLRSALRSQAQQAADPGFRTWPLALRLTEAERREGARTLAGTLGSAATPAEAPIGIYAHASGEKCMPALWWRQVITILRTHVPATPIVEFLPEDGHRRVASDIPSLYTRDLRLLGAALAATSAVVAADCGVIQLAEAAGARVFGLCKTTEPSRYGPCGPDSEALWVRNASADLMATQIRCAL